MIVVSDTSAITSLIQIGRIDLLSKLYQEIYIPHAVRDELAAAHPELPAFIHCRAVTDVDTTMRLKNELDAGEAEAIALAKQLKADDLLMDEASGRIVAIREGLHVIGLLGVLLEAKAHGYISSVGEVTEELESIAGFYVSQTVRKLILREAGEL